MASGGVFNVSFGGHWLAYCIYTNNYFFIFFSRSRWTDLHFHLPIGRKQDYLAQGTMKRITLQISFFSFLFFFPPQEGFLYGKEGWSLEWDSPPHSVPVYTGGLFSLRVNDPDMYVGRLPAFRELHTPLPHFWGAQGLRTLWGRVPSWTCQASVVTLNLVYREKSRALSNIKPSANILVRLCFRQ